MSEVVALLKSRRDETDGVLGSGGLSTDGTEWGAGQMIEDHALADIRSPDDGGNEDFPARELGEELVVQLGIPLLFGEGGEFERFDGAGQFRKFRRQSINEGRRRLPACGRSGSFLELWIGRTGHVGCRNPAMSAVR